MSGDAVRNVPRALRMVQPVRAVIDTSVLRSAVWGGRSSTTLIDAWLEKRVIFCVTESIMADYFQALTRIPPTPLVGVVLENLRNGEAVRAFVRADRGGPPEDALVWCARTAEAAAVVTHDQTLLHLAEVGGVAMLTPGAFVHRFLGSF